MEGYVKASLGKTDDGNLELILHLENQTSNISEGYSVEFSPELLENEKISVNISLNGKQKGFQKQENA